MILRTRILEFNNDPNAKKKVLKTINDFLYSPIITQKIKISCDGNSLNCVVIGIIDNVYDDEICRYVEVAIT